MEKVTYKGNTFEIPVGLCENFSFLCEIISPDTWNNVLNDKQRGTLMNYVPNFPRNNQSERRNALEKFFMNEDFYFGSPLKKFYDDLKNSYYDPIISKLRRLHRKYLFKAYRKKEKRRLHHLLEEILVRRKQILEDKYDGLSHGKSNGHIDYNIGGNSRFAYENRFWKEYFKELKTMKLYAECESDLSEDEEKKFDVSLNKRQRRQVCLLETLFPEELYLVRSTHSKGSMVQDLERSLSHSRNPFDSSDDQFRNLLSSHTLKQKKGICPSLDTSGITMKAILHRCESARKHLQRAPQLHPWQNDPGKSNNSRLPHAKSFSKKRKSRSIKSSITDSQESPIFPAKEIKKEPVSGYISSESDALDNDFPKTESSPSSTQRLPLPITLTQKFHCCFFSLLRDIFCASSNQRLRQRELYTSVVAWQVSGLANLNSWGDQIENWSAELPLAINFLCGNTTPENLPTDFVPFIEYKPGNAYQWIGAGRDHDQNLRTLYHFWFANRSKMPTEWPNEVGSLLNVDQNTVKIERLTSKSSSPLSDLASEPTTDYHRQERTRYTQPHKAFTYRMNGYESVIGPVKGVYSSQIGITTKARGHQLLVPDRPPFVTILSLVWDAVARLPSSEGTKLDICELIKESQFLVPIDNSGLENSLAGVVSGALDRLQNEKDPCVKFDTARKLWIYLHKDRTENELEMMHQLKSRGGASQKSKTVGVIGRKGQKRKESQISDKGPPNVVMEQYTSSIKHMDGSEVQIKDEDILKETDRSSIKSSKGKQTKGTQAAAFLMKKKDNQKVNRSAQVTPISSNVVMSSLKDGDVAGVPLTMENFAESLQKNIASDASLLQTQTSRTYASSTERVQLKAIEGLAGQQHAAQSSFKLIPVSAVSSSSSATGTSHAKAIKILQYSNSKPQGKGITASSLVLDGMSALPAALVGQKLILSGNNILVHGGKVLQNATGANLATSGKQVLTNLVSAQLMPISSFKQPSTSTKLADGSQVVHLASVEHETESQNISKSSLVQQLVSAGTEIKKGASSLSSSNAKSGLSNEVKLKLAPASFSSMAGNIINLDGKQILLTAKVHPNSFVTQENQMSAVLSNEASSSADGVERRVAMLPASIGGATGTTPHRVSILGSGRGQRIVLPASAITGSRFGLKRLQSFKVIPASRVVQRQQIQPTAPLVLQSSTCVASTSGGAAVTGQLSYPENQQDKSNESSS